MIVTAPRRPKLRHANATAPVTRRMGRLFGIASLLLLTFGALSPARADAPGTTAASSTSSAPSGALSPKEAQELLGVLNDPKQRDAFTHTLSLMARGAQQAGATTATAPANTSATSSSIVTPEAVALHSGLSSLGQRARAYGRNFLGLFKDLRSVGVWFDHQIANPTTRQVLIDAFTRAGLIVIVALVIERALVLVIAPRLTAIATHAATREKRLNGAGADDNEATPSDGDASAADNAAVTDALASGASAGTIETLQTRAKDQRRQRETLRFLRRAPYTLAHFGLKLMPVAVFMGVSYGGAELATSTPQAEATTIILAGAYAVARLLFVVVESVLAPRSPAIRLAPASDSVARILTRWWNVLVAAPAAVLCLSNLGEQFDLSAQGTEAVIRTVVLVEHVIIAIFIWRMRPLITRALNRQAPQTQSPFWAFALTLAKAWWIPALFLDAALWLVWAAHLRGGYLWILQTLGLTVAIVIASRVIAILAYGAQDRLFRLSPEMQAKRPELQKRADRYYPFVRAALTATVMFVSIVALTESWGLSTAHFFLSTDLGRHLLGAVITLFIALVVAAIIWETVNDLLNRQLERYKENAQAARATRLRTVLPIIRTVLLTIIIIIVVVTSLSQIGINVTPLLTGAGIMGAAIAFGSQSLVKDFITGFFMLVEDAIQVGDWVTTGGVSGVVEHLSIRAVRVRATNGDLHIIPFSSVSTIANTGRDYNQVIIHQKIDLSEDVARVVAVMAKVVDEMREEDDFKSMIYSGYNDLGVDLSDGDGTVTVGSIRTAPMMKWKVQREFYRRLGNRLVEAGIKFCVPMAYTATPPGGALRVAVDGGAATTPQPIKNTQANDTPDRTEHDNG